jgi:hypothetical protein
MATVVEQRVQLAHKNTERRAVEMVGTSINWQLQVCRPRDLAVLASGDQQLSAWPATNRRLVGVRFLSALNGVQLQRRGADAYAMSAMAAATTAVQGDRIAVRDVHVTDTKFSTRLGPPPLSPPV